jgi:NADH dehydrogenase
VIGGGFAGLELCKRIDDTKYQTVLLDRYNFHTFQPLLYQVATAGLEPSSISGPLRNIFKNKRNFHFRLVEVDKVCVDEHAVHTTQGALRFDLLVVANGTKTNYFGHKEKYEGAFPLKQTPQALALRNSTLRNFEEALSVTNPDERQSMLNVVVVGGGPTGVEVSGAYSELRNKILPCDYPELDFGLMQIHLIEGSGQLLNGMSKKSQENALKALTNMGVQVRLNARVVSYQNHVATLNDGTELRAHTLVWAAGVTANLIPGLEAYAQAPSNRLLVDGHQLIVGTKNVYALGDIALMPCGDYPNGHPQLAQVAIQQAKRLAKNLRHGADTERWTAFRYKDKGSMATIGRNQAVVDLPGNIHFHGGLAWFIWMFVHLMAIIGFRNRVVILMNWIWNYFTYDRSIRLILRAGS